MSTAEIACNCLEICCRFYSEMWHLLGAKHLLARGEAAASAGTLALETSSKLEAGTAASLLGWSEPLCGRTGPRACIEMCSVCLPALTS